METINRKEMINAKSASDLTQGVNESVAKIEAFVAFNDYVLNASLEELKNPNLIQTIQSMSLNKRKTLRNYLWKLANHPSLASINRYLHFLAKKVLKNETVYRILKSKKQLTIEEKRKKYTDALAVAKVAKADYLAEKADFYKLRLSKGQKI